MPTPDYYDILGVAREAKPDEIRAAYRAKARRLHPDVNKAPDAQERFAELQQAYETLSDDAKRRRYDRFGTAEPAAAAGQWHSGPFAESVDLEDLGSMFDSFFRSRGATPPHQRSHQQHHAPRQRATPLRGPDVRRTITVALEDIARGATVRTPSPAGGTVDVRIPRGCADGATLRVRGHGQPAPRPGAQPGDLLLDVQTAPHPRVSRGRPHKPDGKSLDLALSLPITFAEAALGASIEVDTLEGTVTLNIPAGTASGKTLRLKDRGLRDETGHTGSLYAMIRIVPPDPATLDGADRDALQRIAQRQPDPRLVNRSTPT